MFHKQCEKIVVSGIRNGSIDKSKKEEYIYGMNILFDAVINIITMLFIGLVTKKLWESIVFCLVYKTIRKYTGGFHFDSAVICYISSCVMCFLSIFILTYVPFSIYEVSVIVVISAIIIWIISPVAAIKKPLDESEKKVFKRRARIIISMILIIYLICLYISYNLAYMIGIGIFWVMSFAIIGNIQTTLYNKKTVTDLLQK